MCGSCSNTRPIETSMAAGRTTMASDAMPKTTTRSSSWAGSCFDRRHLCGRLEKAHSVAFGIEKACIQTNARNIHRLPEHLPSRPSYLFQCFFNYPEFFLRPTTSHPEFLIRLCGLQEPLDG